MSNGCPSHSNEKDTLYNDNVGFPHSATRQNCVCLQTIVLSKRPIMPCIELRQASTGLLLAAEKREERKKSKVNV